MFGKRSKKAKIEIPNLHETSGEPELVKKHKVEDKGSLFSYTDDKGLRAYDGFATAAIAEQEHCSIKDALKQKEISTKIYSGELDSNEYRGQKAYALYAEKSNASIYASKYTGSLGPVQAPSHVRSTCRFDYAYGLCKDWRVSGYCGYGDSCIFVHDRTEVKTGWELEKEWEKEQEEKRRIALSACENKEEGKNEEIDEKKKCAICQGNVEVTTKCKHEFCYKCCLEQFKKTAKCYVCGKDTKGIINDIKDSQTAV